MRSLQKSLQANVFYYENITLYNNNLQLMDFMGVSMFLTQKRKQHRRLLFLFQIPLSVELMGYTIKTFK